MGGGGGPATDRQTTRPHRRVTCYAIPDFGLCVLQVTMSLSGLHFETFFQEADVNNDGHLDLQELIATLKKYGYKNRDDEIKVTQEEKTGRMFSLLQNL